MKKDYSNLKNKTVFDFTKDPVILEEVLPYIPKGCDRDQYLKDYWAQSPHQLAFSFIDLAEIIGDDELKKQAESQFEKELTAYFNE
ncbi:MAG: hypothetical protein NC110_00180 [Ruminococcus sp.]|nr:hypothetical protein [Ruminococcus sp.]MCM1543693.1 hypothetical protein [Ruminococcus sp.]